MNLPLSSPVPGQPKFELFSKVFGPELAELKKAEWIQIDRRTGELSKRIFGEITDQHMTEGAVTGEKVIAIMLKLSFMLIEDERASDAHCQSDREIIDIAHKVFKTVKKGIKQEEWRSFSSEIIGYITTQLNYQRKLKDWEGGAAQTQMRLANLLTSSTDSAIGRLGQDIQRHFRDNNTIKVEGLEIQQISPRPANASNSENTAEKAIQMRAQRFEAFLNAFVDKLCDNKLRAVALKRNWKNLAASCSSEQSFAEKIQEIYIGVSARSNDRENANLLCLLRAMNQSIYVGPSSAVRSALIAIIQPEVHSYHQNQLLKDISEGYGITFQFGENSLSIVAHQSSINNDHPVSSENEEQKRTLEKYQTKCKFELTVKNTMTASYHDFTQWSSLITVLVGIPPQSKQGADKIAVDEVLQALKIAGYKVETHDLENELVWVKAR